MATFIDVEDFDLILDEPGPERRAGLACRLFADYEAGDLDDIETRAALSVFRAIARDPETPARIRFAEFAADSEQLPADVAERLACDQRRVACPVIAQSPVLSTEVLVDIVGSGDFWCQLAVARREQVTAPLAAALAEVAPRDVCLELVNNPGAVLPATAFERLFERFGDHEALRDAMLKHPEVPSTLVESHLAEIAERVSRFVTAAGWLDRATVAASASAAIEQALIAHAAGRRSDEAVGFVRRWIESRRVGATFVVRAAFLGADVVLEHALAAGARVPVDRIRQVLDDRTGYAVRAVCSRAGLGGDVATAIIRARVARAAAAAGVGAASRAEPAARKLIAEPEFCPELALSPSFADIARQIAAPPAPRRPAAATKKAA